MKTIICPRPNNNTAHGVPASAGGTWFRPGSRNVPSCFQEATPFRLKPGLHTLKPRLQTLHQPRLVVEPYALSFPDAGFGLGSSLTGMRNVAHSGRLRRFCRVNAALLLPGSTREGVKCPFGQRAGGLALWVSLVLGAWCLVLLPIIGAEAGSKDKTLYT